MSDVFSINRFILFFKREWFLKGRFYIFSTLVAIGVVSSFYLYNFLRNLSSDLYIIVLDSTFRLGLFLFISSLYLMLINSSYFVEWSRKAVAIRELMIPVSSFEKFLTALMYTFIMPVIAFTILFSLVDYGFVKYSVSLLNDSSPELINSVNDGKITTYFYNRSWNSLQISYVCLPFLSSSLYLLGSISFRSFHFVKTALSLLLFTGVWLWILTRIVKLYNNTIYIGEKVFFGRGNEEQLVFLVCAIGVFIALYAWYIVYLKIKEKEV